MIWMRMSISATVGHQAPGTRGQLDSFALHLPGNGQHHKVVLPVQMVAQ